MKDIAGSIIGMACYAIPVFVIWLVWSRLTRKRNRGTEADFDEAYEKRSRTPRQCGNCGYDLRATPHRCPECGATYVNRPEYLRRLREDWPDNPLEPRVPGALESPEMLVSVKSAEEANLLRDQLIARGIACSIGTSRILGRYSSELIFQEVMVYSADLPAARLILEKAQSPADR